MDTSLLFIDWLGKPIWMWLRVITLVIAILSFDLGVLHKENKEIEVGESIKLSALYISLGLAFGGWVWWYLVADAGLAYKSRFRPSNLRQRYARRLPFRAANPFQ